MIDVKLAARLISSLLLVLGLVYQVRPQNPTSPVVSRMTESQVRGRQLYRKGSCSGCEIMMASLGDDGVEMPATTFPCANCHGFSGQGGREAGLQPPPLSWDVLTKEYRSPFNGRRRSSYDEKFLLRAIAAGVDSDGIKLHPGMPRYRWRTQQLNDLIGYLKILGGKNDEEPGVSETTIRLGAVLPLTGAFASIGREVQSILLAFWAEKNAQGGIYGRKVELIFEDSSSDLKQAVVATERLIDKRDVFVLNGSFQQRDDPELNELLRGKEVPLVGPVTLSPLISDAPNPLIYYLLPTFRDQARVLTDFIVEKLASEKARSGQMRFAILAANTAFNRDAIAGVKVQLQVHGSQIVLEQLWESGLVAAKLPVVALVEALRTNQPDAVFFFSTAADLKLLSEQLSKEKLAIPILSSSVMLGREIAQLPDSVNRQLYLSYSTVLPELEPRYGEFEKFLNADGNQLRATAFQAIAYSAAQVCFEALKQSGRQLHRDAFRKAMESMFNFETVASPPVTFNANRRVGAIGSYVVQFDQQQGKFVPLTKWREPQ